jgi:hypothetical protein
MPACAGFLGLLSLTEQFGITTNLVTIAERGIVFEIEASRKVGSFEKSNCPKEHFFPTKNHLKVFNFIFNPPAMLVF